MDQFKRKTDNGMKGSFGETDLKKKEIKINRKLHKVKSGKHYQKNPDGTENLLNTMHHEELHAKHPDWSEKQVVNKAKMDLKNMDKKAKSKIYSRYF